MNWILLFGGLLSWVVATLVPSAPTNLVLRVVAAILFGVALVLLLVA